MNELVKSMLPIGARLSPHNRAGTVVHTRALLGNVLAIRFHITLSGKRSITFLAEPHSTVQASTHTSTIISAACLQKFHKYQGYTCLIYRHQDNGGVRGKKKI